MPLAGDDFDCWLGDAGLARPPVRLLSADDDIGRRTTIAAAIGLASPRLCLGICQRDLPIAASRAAMPVPGSGRRSPRS